MEFADHLILVGAGLVVFSIIVGLVSSRFGAPLLLVFLVLGMLAGEDGPGGIEFDDFHASYLVGSIALAVILFDGGLRTRRSDLRASLAPAATLSTVGVVLTAVITGAAASWFLDLEWLEGLLIGSVVASTDAAAVFLLLHAHELRLRDRVRSTLEVEAGLNDPMAVFLTVGCVELLMAGHELSFDSLGILAGRFAVQALVGAVVGIAGGRLMLAAFNRLSIAAGLYPVLSLAMAVLLFAGAQVLGGSGFLAVYLAGYVFGSRRHRATLIINRFHDGLAWLSQIGLFLMLGLLVTPSALVPLLIPALGIAAVLIFVARPIAGFLCLPAFGFSRRENAFISWVGLRGAVPIYLGTIPVIAGLDGAVTYFQVVFVLVIASLVVQGWTIGLSARRLGMTLPPRPAAPPRVDIDMPAEVSRDMTAYTVQPASLALRRPLSRLPLPPGSDIVTVIRDGVIRAPQALERLAPGDYVLLMTGAEQLPTLDRLFGAKPRGRDADAAVLGEFVFSAETAVGAIAEAYDFNVPVQNWPEPVGRFLGRHIYGRPAVGKRLALGPVQLVVREVVDGRIALVGIELEPDDNPLRRLGAATIWLKGLFWYPALQMGRMAKRRLAQASRRRAPEA